AIPGKLLQAEVKAARALRPDRSNVKLRDGLRSARLLRQQVKEGRHLEEGIDFLDSLTVVEFEFGPVEASAGLGANQVVGQGEARRGGQAKHGIVFNAEAGGGKEPVPKVAMQLAGITEVVALNRRHPLILEAKAEERGEMRIEDVVRLHIDEIA